MHPCPRKENLLYSNWLYKKTDNVLSLVSGISSLNSWTRRFCMVLERGDPTVLELALFRMKDDSDNPVHFTAIDQESFDAWKVFFIHQQQRLADRRQLTVSRHDNNSRSMVPAASMVTLPPNVGLGEEENNCRAIRQSLQTTPHTLDSTNAALSRSLLPVSAPDSDDREECELIGNAAETKESCAESKPSFASEQNLPVVHSGETSAYSSTGGCVICLDGPLSAVCVPCGHNAVCMKCAEEIQTFTAECPVCRAHIRELIKFYRV
ncbi:unnamed protein product [Peronospora destructor]|uniref:RING-type domain-containing protein n=1 Tax=Peronospora destructor TaxID=86335 RepID=A0AAV0U7V0_9STRA|nr:unnamed protein product [Peronospora destructor]